MYTACADSQLAVSKDRVVGVCGVHAQQLPSTMLHWKVCAQLVSGVPTS